MRRGEGHNAAGEALPTIRKARAKVVDESVESLGSRHVQIASESRPCVPKAQAQGAAALDDAARQHLADDGVRHKVPRVKRLPLRAKGMQYSGIKVASAVGLLHRRSSSFRRSASSDALM